MRRGILLTSACATVVASATILHSLLANGKPPPPTPTVYIHLCRQVHI
jgi:hypothetical protein